MISNTTKGLIDLALLNLEPEIITQKTINKAIDYLKEAVLQIKKEEENSNANILCYLQTNTTDKISYSVDPSKRS